MSLLPWEHVSEETLARYKIFDVVRAQRRSPRTAAEIGMFLIRTWDWVQVVPFTSGGELILVRQYRQGSATLSLEIPGGIAPPGEDAVATAARELREETGYEAGEIVRLAETNPNPAIFTNRLHTFLATDCTLAGEPALDPGEDLETVHMTLEEADELVRRGEIHNALVLAGLYAYRLSSRSG